MTVAEHRTASGGITLYDLEPSTNSLSEEVVRGLSRPEKTLPCKFLYDERGAQLFDRICTLEAYYPTRTEIGVLGRHGAEIAALLGPRCRVVELGSGSGIKTHLLLRHLDDPTSYIPVDISKAQLLELSISLSGSFPELEVLPVCADYTADLFLPPARTEAARTVAFFPGSTIGNLEPEEAEAFLRRVYRLCAPDGGLLLGVDLKKDEAVLERAYNDPQGVTAAFNLNLLERINRECDADFDLGSWEHRAVYDPAHGRVEMRLVSRRAQRVRLFHSGGQEAVAVEFREGEAITTEHCYKYDLPGFRALAERAGFRVERVWTDERQLFSVQYLRC
jgi:dimethylhistidine N-methyltransferase